jgi:hypothetical protein
MRIQLALAALILAGLSPLRAEAPGEPVLLGVTLGMSVPMNNDKMELSSATLYNNGISQKNSFELGAVAEAPLAPSWSTRLGAAYSFESPKFPVNTGDGTLAPRDAHRDQWDVYGQGVRHFGPWYALAGLDYVHRTLRVAGNDLDTFRKGGYSVGAGYTLRVGRLRIEPEAKLTKAGQESRTRIQAAFLF